MVKKFLRLLLYCLFLFFLITFVNALFNNKKQSISTNPNLSFPFKDSVYIHLSRAIAFKTISYDDSSDGYLKIQELKKLHDYFKTTFPLLHSKASRILFSNGSVLYHLKGKNQELKPALFLAHLDVVPVEEKSEKTWKNNAFAGTINKDTIWGRGTLDDKFCALALLEVAEYFLQKNILLNRDIYFAFGHDEETLGTGAQSIAEFLKNKHIEAEFILDEGLGVMHNLVPGIEKPTALIGLTEKGICTIKLSAQGAGGHSSMPEKENANTMLIDALHKIQNRKPNQFFSEPMSLFFKHAAPEMKFPYKYIFSNLWCYQPLIKFILNGDSKTRASIESTLSTTIIKSGIKENVIPEKAEAIVNVRILPGETAQTILNNLNSLVRNSKIKLEFVGPFFNPPPTSPVQSSGYQIISNSIKETFNNTIVLPAQVIAGTDAKHYTSISKNIYRFVPLLLYNENISSIHGANEYITKSQYKLALNFYFNCFRNL